MLPIEGQMFLLFNNLDPEEIVEFFENAALYTDNKISNVPPVLPIEGQINQIKISGLQLATLADLVISV